MINLVGIIAAYFIIAVSLIVIMFINLDNGDE